MMETVNLNVRFEKVLVNALHLDFSQTPMSITNKL